jgi:hypothetical protein
MDTPVELAPAQNNNVSIQGTTAVGKLFMPHEQSRAAATAGTSAGPAAGTSTAAVPPCLNVQCPLDESERLLRLS